MQPVNDREAFMHTLYGVHDPLICYGILTPDFLPCKTYAVQKSFATYFQKISLNYEMYENKLWRFACVLRLSIQRKMERHLKQM